MSNGFEAYPRYQNYLHGEAWPSASHEGTVPVPDMVPRYASSALQKLLRWGATYQARVALNIHNDSERLRYIRNTVLGRALSCQAQGLAPEPPPAPQAISAREMILAFAPVVAEQTNLDITRIFKLCEALAEHAEREWTTTIKSR